MTDPAEVAQFDQTRGALSTDVDDLVQALLDAHATCDCSGEVDSMNHLIAFAQIYQREFRPAQLSALLIVAVARLALAKEAQ